MINIKFKVTRLEFQRQFGTRKAEVIPIRDLFVIATIDEEDVALVVEGGDLTGLGLAKVFEQLEVALIEATDF